MIMKSSVHCSLVAASVILLVSLLLPLPAGAQYCTVRGCCPGRDDECTSPFYDTLCYCDVFCNTTAADCCPDFWYCMGLPQPKEVRQQTTEKPFINTCVVDGVTYNPGESVQVNCNKCTCVGNDNGNAAVACDNEPCLVDPDMIEDINSDFSWGWRASNYSFLWGLTQREGVLYRLGTFPPGSVVSSMTEVRIETDGNLPENFDARVNWPGLIGNVFDQGNCGSSWAVSTTSVASDRLAIQSVGGLNLRLSEQHLLSCNVRGQQGCSGGYLDKAWWFMRRPGIVSRQCYPYESGLAEDTIMKRLKCRISTGNNRCPEEGVTPDVYQSTPPYRIATRELDIMTEIYRNGPVQATFNVKKDFFVYNSGVYRHAFSTFTAIQEDISQAGWHSVKIIGWGVDRTDPFRPVKYWICTNSWGRNWGEDGTFRIIRGENESDIESFVLGVWMRVNQNQLNSG